MQGDWRLNPALSAVNDKLLQVLIIKDLSVTYGYIDQNR